MLRTNSELRAAARAALQGRWGSAVIFYLVYSLIAIAGGAIPWGGNIFTLLVGLPMSYGLSIVFLNAFRGQKEIDISGMFMGFAEYGRVLGTAVLMYVYVFLWTLLLIVPGIVKGYSYSMTYYIMRDNPELCNNAAIERSMQMMDGHKMRLFMLDLSFIGWALLCLLTLGIGYLWLGPYVSMSHAAFYEDLKAQQNEVPGVVAM